MDNKNCVSKLNVLVIGLFALSLSACLQQAPEEASENPSCITSDCIDHPPGSIPSTSIKSQTTHYRGRHTATLLDDGRVLVTGGSADIVESEIYDPSTDTWSLGPLPVIPKRLGGSAIKLPDGRVFIAGGNQHTNSGFHPEILEIEMYDPTTNAFSVVNSFAHSRNGATFSLLPSGEILITGGVDYDETKPLHLRMVYYKDAEIYNPSTNQLRPTLNDLDYARAGHRAVVFPNGHVHLIGGTGLGYGEIGNTESFNPSSEGFTETNGLFKPRYNTFTFLLPNNKVIIAGGEKNISGVITPVTDVQVVRNWAPGHLQSLPRGMYGASSTQLQDGTPILIGGESITNGNGNKDIHAFDIVSEEFVKIGEISDKRPGAVSTVLNDGSILITGGFSQADFVYSNKNYSERIDLSTIILP